MASSKVGKTDWLNSLPATVQVAPKVATGQIVVGTPKATGTAGAKIGSIPTSVTPTKAGVEVKGGIHPATTLNPTPLEASGKYTVNAGLKDAYAALVAAQNAYANPAADNTYTAMAAAYEQRARESLAQQEAALLAQLNASKAATAKNYDASASQNYINYMRQRGALPEQLAALGINGGASETALARVMNNYALGQGANEASRNSAISTLQGSHDTNVANLRRATEDNIAANALEMQQKQAQFDYQRQTDAYNRLQDAYARASTLEQQQYERKQAAKENSVTSFKQGLTRYAATKSGLEAIQKALKKYKKNHKGDSNYTAYVRAYQERIGTIKETIRQVKLSK